MRARRGVQYNTVERLAAVRDELGFAPGFPAFANPGQRPRFTRDVFNGGSDALDWLKAFFAYCVGKVGTELNTLSASYTRYKALADANEEAFVKLMPKLADANEASRPMINMVRCFWAAPKNPVLAAPSRKLRFRDNGRRVCFRSERL